MISLQTDNIVDEAAKFIKKEKDELTIFRRLFFLTWWIGKLPELYYRKYKPTEQEQNYGELTFEQKQRRLVGKQIDILQFKPQFFEATEFLPINPDLKNVDRTLFSVEIDYT